MHDIYQQLTWKVFTSDSPKIDAISSLVSIVDSLACPSVAHRTPTVKSTEVDENFMLQIGFKRCWNR